MSKQEQLADALARLGAQVGSVDDAIMVGVALGLTFEQMSAGVDRVQAVLSRQLEAITGARDAA